MTDMVEIKVNDRWPLIVPKHRADRPEWSMKNGGWEVERLNAMQRDIENSPYKDTLVIDIGMEEADITALMVSWGADVVGLEPNAKVWPNIKAIFDANKFSLYGGAVSFAAEESKGSGYFYCKDDYGGSGLSWPKEANGKVIGDHGFLNLSERAEEIGTIAIDDMVRWTADMAKVSGHKKFGKVPYMITIDVEGSELRVLKGAEKTLKEVRPIVYVSVHDAFMHTMYDEYAADLFKYMKDLGYEYELLAYDHELHCRFIHPDRSFH